MLERTNRAYGAIVPKCPFCGHETFIEFKGRESEKCEKCRIPSRVRANWAILEHLVRVNPDTRIAHFAPEELLAKKLKAICGDNYYPYDLVNERYKFGFPVGKIDMCTDLGTLPQGFYDVVLHTHVLEHVPFNYTIVLQRLHNLIKPGGYHIFSFPILPGHYREDQSPRLPLLERKTRFGQRDHLRRFGKHDFVPMVGCIFGITEDYSLTDWVSEEALIANGIPEERWRLSGTAPVFVVRKD